MERSETVMGTPRIFSNACIQDGVFRDNKISLLEYLAENIVLYSFSLPLASPRPNIGYNGNFQNKKRPICQK